MNARNFDIMMQNQIESARGDRLLLHCCCAPCSSACLERLHGDFKISVLFYNPNIDEPEYSLRKGELKKFITATGWAEIIDCDSPQGVYKSAVAGLEKEREGGKRCEACFKLRLQKTAELADKYGFDYFATTLTLSPLKNAELINSIGESINCKAKWLYSDFKKRNGYLRSIELSKQYDLYRQNYCGCEYSKKDID